MLPKIIFWPRNSLSRFNDELNAVIAADEKLTALVRRAREMEPARLDYLYLFPGTPEAYSIHRRITTVALEILYSHGCDLTRDERVRIAMGLTFRWADEGRV